MAKVAALPSHARYLELAEALEAPNTYPCLCARRFGLSKSEIELKCPATAPGLHWVSSTVSAKRSHCCPRSRRRQLSRMPFYCERTEGFPFFAHNRRNSSDGLHNRRMLCSASDQDLSSKAPAIKGLPDSLVKRWSSVQIRQGAPCFCSHLDQMFPFGNDHSARTFTIAISPSNTRAEVISVRMG